MKRITGTPQNGTTATPHSYFGDLVTNATLDSDYIDFFSLSNDMEDLAKEIDDFIKAIAQNKYDIGRLGRKKRHIIKANPYYCVVNLKMQKYLALLHRRE